MDCDLLLVGLLLTVYCLVMRCWLFDGCLFVVGCVLLFASGLLFDGLLLTVCCCCCLLFVVDYCVLSGCGCMLFVDCVVLIVYCVLLFVVWLLVVSC